jgi:hypothetical protein
MVALAGHEKEKKRKIAMVRKPFANQMTRAMVDRHAVNLQVRIDRRKRESASDYQREFNRIAGRIARGGVNHAEMMTQATQSFVALHGQRHLPN